MVRVVGGSIERILCKKWANSSLERLRVKLNYSLALLMRSLRFSGTYVGMDYEFNSTIIFFFSPYLLPYADFYSTY